MHVAVSHDSENSPESASVRFWASCVQALTQRKALVALGVWMSFSILLELLLPVSATRCFASPARI
jgi:hypothetical protein